MKYWKSDLAWGLVGGFAALLFVFGLACGITPKQASDAAEGSCKVLEAFIGNAIVDTVCATAPELAAIGADIAAKHAAENDGGRTAKLERCRVIPTVPEAVCATEPEIADAIRKTKAARQ